MKQRISGLAGAVAAGTLFLAAGGAGAQVIIQENLSKDAQRVTIKLEAVSAPNASSGGQIHSGQFETTPIPERLARRAGDKYTQFADLGEVGGTNYYLLVGEGKRAPSLTGDGQPRAYDGLILSATTRDGAQVEKVAEGAIQFGYQGKLPFSRKVDPIGTNGLTEIAGELQFSLNGSSNEKLSGSRTLNSRVSLQGSQIMEKVRLSVTITPIVDRKLDPGKQQWTLTANPVDGKGEAKSASGALNSTLSVGGATFAVEKYADNLSELTIAVVSGELAGIALEPKPPLTELPEVAQVSLARRKLVSKADLLGGTTGSQAIVLVFGDLTGRPNPYMGYNPMGAGNSLALPPDTIIDILGRDLSAAPKVVFVVRSLPLSMFYETYLNKDIPFDLLADYSDPMQTQFIGSPNQPYYGQPQQSRTSLRSSLGLPEDKACILAVDQTGKVLHLATNGADLNAMLLETNRKLKEAQ